MADDVDNADNTDILTTLTTLATLTTLRVACPMDLRTCSMVIEHVSTTWHDAGHNVSTTCLGARVCLYLDTRGHSHPAIILTHYNHFDTLSQQCHTEREITHARITALVYDSVMSVN